MMFLAALRKVRAFLLSWRSVKKLRRIAPSRWELINTNCADTFEQLAVKFGTDKATIAGYQRFEWKSHRYGEVYSLLFGHCRTSVVLVFECGIGTTSGSFQSNMGSKGQPGASLRLWKEFFPEARVIGADIDTAVLFHEDRIDTFFVDQLDVSTISSMWTEIGADEFDVIIDDGLHEFTAGENLLKASISKLRAEGLYIIEDVRPSFVPGYLQLSEELNLAMRYFRPVPDEYGPNAADGLVIFKKKAANVG